MATMTTTLSPLRERRAPALPFHARGAGALAVHTTVPDRQFAPELALADIFPDLRAAADAALADLFPALRLRRATELRA